MKKVFLVLLVALSTVSCLDSTKDKASWWRDVYGTFKSTNLMTSETYTPSGAVTCSVNQPNLYDAKINITLKDIRLEAQGEQFSLGVNNIPFTVYSGSDGMDSHPAGSWVFDSQNLPVVINGTVSNDYVVSILKGHISDVDMILDLDITTSSMSNYNIRYEVVQTSSNPAWKKTTKGYYTSIDLDSQTTYAPTGLFNCLMEQPSLNENLINLSLLDVRLNANDPARRITLCGVSYVVCSEATELYPAGTHILSGKNVTLEINNTVTTRYTISSIDGYIGDNIAAIQFDLIGSAENIESYQLRFALGLEEEARLNGYQFSGTITSGTGSTDPYVQSDPVGATISCPVIYTQNIDIAFRGVKFAEMMPPSNITLPALPYKSIDGIWYIDAENIIPTIGGIPYENRLISTVSGHISPDEIDITFVMNLKMSETSNPIPYTVTYKSEIN